MTIVTICGGYITKRQGHWLKLTLTIVSGLVSVLSLVGTVLSWFNINLFEKLWDNVLHPAVISVGTVALWIIIVAIAICLLGFAIYGIVKLICYIKEEKEWKINKTVYEKQRDLINGIARENSKNDVAVKPTIINHEETATQKPTSERAATTALITAEVSVNTNVEETQVEQQMVLPDVYELKISNNICPICGWYLKKRRNGQTGEQFRGCSNYGYHNCTFTISNEEYLRIYKKYH